MNLVKAFTVLALSACTTAGVVVAASVEASTQVVAEETRTLYFSPSNEWLADGARFAVYTWGDTGNNWANCYKVNVQNVYQFSFPANHNKAIFCRMNGSATTNSWDNKWNQTADIDLVDGSNYFTLNSGMSNNGTWSNYVDSTTTIYFPKIWENVYIYSYGGNKTFGEWPGKLLTDTDKVNMLKINDNDIYAIDSTTLVDTMIIFNNNSGTQTGNLIYNPGYYYDNDDNLTGHLYEGDAIAFGRKLTNERLNATDYSICNIPAAKRAELIDEYNNLSEGAKGVVDNHLVIWTYADETKTNSADIQVSAIMAQLASMQNGAASNAARLAPIMDEKKTPYYVIAVIFTLSAATVLFVGVRKRKHN